MKANEFIAKIAHQNASTARDMMVLDAVRDGNAMRWPWIEITLANGRGTFRAAQDYFSIGEWSDWVRVPVGGAVAQLIADEMGAVLPCAFLVDQIWKAAEVKLTPIAMSVENMTSTEKFVEHNRLIEDARKGQTGLIAGIKKDVVITNKLISLPNATAIYGWHWPNGTRRQPLSTAHHEPYYSDYSHGVRLIHPEIVIDGKTMRLQDVMQSAELAAIVTGGPEYAPEKARGTDAVLRIVRYPSASQIAVPKAIAPPSPMPPSATSAETLGERALAWCLRELAADVHEEPLGSSTGPRIREYFAPARRRGSEQLVGITAGDWCAAAQSAALAAVLKPSEPKPHGYRAAVVELQDDAKAAGSWIPVDAVKRGTATVRRGDLAIYRHADGWKGHVTRVESPPDKEGAFVAVGANEGDRWRRRGRSLHDSELAGFIAYTFSPANRDAFVAPPPAAAIQSASQSPKYLTSKGQLDSWAKDVLLAAWQEVFPGTQPSPAELQTILAVGRYEGSYGKATKPAAWIGSNNWGGVQCGAPPCKENCFEHSDKRRDGTEYAVCFRKYATPQAGAKHLIELLTIKRPHVWAAMKRGDLKDVALKMGQPATINGKEYKIYHETKPEVYGAALWRNAQSLATNNGMPLAVRFGEQHPAMMSSSPPTSTQLVSYRPQSSPVRGSTAQAGIRALVAQRSPKLVGVVVGGSAYDAFYNEMRAEADWEEALAGGPIKPCDTTTTGIDTNTNVLARAARVDNYIAAIQLIVDAEYPKKLPQTFPLSEWAMFRVSWLEYYEVLKNSWILWGSDSSVREWEKFAYKWADVCEQHLGKRPATPQPDTPSDWKKPAIAVAATLGLVFGVGYLIRSVR